MLPDGYTLEVLNTTMETPRLMSFLPNGDLLVFCEARKDNLSDDGNIDLVVKHGTDGGASWNSEVMDAALPEPDRKSVV